MARKVLIIEDSAMDAAIVQELLIKCGLEVEVAINGKEGLDKALKLEPDLIILDLILPDIDGIEVCERLKQEPNLYNTIVVVLTIRDEVQDINKAFRVNADDYIIKPLEPEFLVRKIKLYLGMKDLNI